MPERREEDDRRGKHNKRKHANARKDNSSKYMENYNYEISKTSGSFNP